MATYYVDPQSTTVVTWAATTAYATTTPDRVCPTNLTSADAKSIYECTTSGTSGGTEPLWDEIVGNTTADGTVVWTARAPDSWTEALKNVQPAFDLAVAGDTVYCRGTQTCTANIDVDAQDGTTANLIHFIGCDAAGTARAGQFVINGNGTYSPLRFNDRDGYWIEYFTFRNSNAAGVNSAALFTYYQLFEHCLFEDNVTDGVAGGGYIRYSSFINCVFEDNVVGIDSVYYTLRCANCLFRNNTGWGIKNGYSVSYFDKCLFYNNTLGGLHVLVDGLYVDECVFDGNGGDGLNLATGVESYHISNSRFTGNIGWGINVTTGNALWTYADRCVFFANTSGASQNIVLLSTNNTAPTDEGYTNRERTVEFINAETGAYTSPEEVWNLDGTKKGIVVASDTGASGTLTYTILLGAPFTAADRIIGQTSLKDGVANANSLVGANIDYNIKSGAEIRSTALVLNWNA